MDVNTPGSTPRKTKNGLHLYPVSPGDSGEGLPYAPEDWPNPGDKWRWKTGKRVTGAGYIWDRHLYLPRHLVKAGQPKYFRSKSSVKKHIQSAFPGADVNGFFASFSWHIPSKQFNSNELLGVDSQFAPISCKADNNMCISLPGVCDPPTEPMFCDICCSEPGFCRNCCCILCSKAVCSAFGGYSYIRCKAMFDGYICGHVAHMACAHQACLAGTVGGTFGLDAEYLCRRCDSRTDLVSHILEVLQTCKSIDSRDEIEKTLNLAISLLHGSRKMNARWLLNHIESISAKLKNGANFGDVWKKEDAAIEGITAAQSLSSIAPTVVVPSPSPHCRRHSPSPPAVVPVVAPGIMSDSDHSGDEAYHQHIDDIDAELAEADITIPQPGQETAQSTVPDSSDKSKSKVDIISKIAKKLSGRRGPFKGLKKKAGPLKVDFDHLGRHTGEHRLSFGQHIGVSQRKFDITWEWKDVPIGLRTTLWEDTMNLFNLKDDPALKKIYLSNVSRRFRDFKSKLVNGYVSPPEDTSSKAKPLPYDIYPHISKEMWEAFVAKQTTPEARAKRAKARESARQNRNHHHMGSHTFEESRIIWIDEGIYPGVQNNNNTTSTSSSHASVASTRIDSSSINRGDDWWCSMHVKQPDGTWKIPNPHTQDIANKYMEYRQKQHGGEFKPVQNKDALYMALREKANHTGRTYGHGGTNVGLTKVWGYNDSRLSKTHCTHTSKSIEEMVKTQVAQSMQAFFQQMGFPNIQLPGATSSFAASSFAQHSAPQSFESQPDPDLKESKKCYLFLESSSGDVFPVACGISYPLEPNAHVHHVPLLPGHLKVSIDTVLEETRSAPVPVPILNYDIATVGDAQGRYLQWPMSLISFDSHGMPPKSKKQKHSARKPETRTHMLSKELQLLKNLAESLPTDDPLEIPLDVDQFHLDDESIKVVYLDKDDIFQFITGAMLDIVVIHIFTMAMVEDIANSDVQSSIGWLCPQTVCGTACLANPTGVKTYIARSFGECVSNGQYSIIIPYYEEHHWVLIVVQLFNGVVSIFDSIRTSPPRSLLLIPLLNSVFKNNCPDEYGKRRSLKVQFQQCAQQIDGLSCGYYLMKNMCDLVSDVITGRQMNEVISGMKREGSFSTEEIEEVKSKWVKFVTFHYF